MKTIAQSIVKQYYIHAIPYDANYNTPGDPTHFYTISEGESYYATGSVMVEGPIEVTFDVPGNFDLLQPTIDSMKAKQEDIRETAMEEVAAIEEQLQNMLALPAPTDA